MRRVLAPFLISMRTACGVETATTAAIAMEIKKREMEQATRKIEQGTQQVQERAAQAEEKAKQ